MPKGDFRCLEAILALRVEAGAAIDRTVSAGLERNLGGLSATVADHIVHLALSTSTAVVRAASRTASGAATGLILEALVGIELLLRSGENKFRAALTANQGLVFKHGKNPPKCVCPNDDLPS